MKSTEAGGQCSAVLMHMEDLSFNSKVTDIQGRAPFRCILSFLGRFIYYFKSIEFTDAAK